MRLEYIRSSPVPYVPVRPHVPSFDPSHSIRDGMEMPPISRKMDALLAAHRRSLEFFEWFSARGTRAGIADFVAGNPQEMPLPEYVAAIKKWSEPRRKDWFAYHMNVPEARRAIVASLFEHRGIRFAAEDIALTTGAFAGLEVAMRAVCDEGDEVIYLTPPWFFYDGIAKGLGLLPVKVRVDMRRSTSTWRPSSGRSPRGRAPSSSTLRTTRPERSIRARRSIVSLLSSRPPRRGTGARSTCCRTRPITASSTTAAITKARPSRIRVRSSSTPTASSS